jgi:hypothetical protein
MEKEIMITKLTEEFIEEFENNLKNYLKLSYEELPNFYSDKKKIINELLDIEEIIPELEKKIKDLLLSFEDLSNLSDLEEEFENIAIEVLSEEIELIYETNSFSPNNLSSYEDEY